MVDPVECHHGHGPVDLGLRDEDKGIGIHSHGQRTLRDTDLVTTRKINRGDFFPIRKHKVENPTFMKELPVK